MTVVQITNKDNTIQTGTEYFIEIEITTSIEYDYTNAIQTELPIPHSTDNQSGASEFKIIDLQKRRRVVTVTGVVDKFSNYSSSTTTGTTANKLVDTSVNFTTLGVISGCVVRNTKDNTIATVTAVDSATVLSLSKDIMVSGEAYYINIPVNDVSVVRKRLNSMWDGGGVNTLLIGVGDGYLQKDNATADNPETITGVILKMKMTETVDDHYDKTSNSYDYPSSTKEKTSKYGIILTFLEAQLTS